ncbi:hypothetical protein CLV30_1164 [Haloactinopolyspora alba]|uniref:Uncharacterized protein n=1 Tax=Haloactinopolyspora alba TaxID=648780 RepID=A0A2P8DT01_9ACTN|nr:hypothetical protein CLV30_1164 [Haloactinopolyspora alba]
MFSSTLLTRDTTNPGWCSCKRGEARSPSLARSSRSRTFWGYGSRDVVLPEDAFYHTAEWT